MQYLHECEGTHYVSGRHYFTIVYNSKIMTARHVVCTLGPSCVKEDTVLLLGPDKLWLLMSGREMWRDVPTVRALYRDNTILR